MISFNVKTMSNMSDMANELSASIAKDVQNEILSQLNYLVSRGLLEVEYGPLVMTQDPTSNSLNVSKSVNLVLKEKEYIDKLELENDKLIGENLKLKEMIKAMVDAASRNV